MKVVYLLLLMIAIPAILQGQKNVVPAAQTQMLGISLPEGSKQDKRLLSVAAAGAFLSMSSEHENSEYSPVEVYSIPVTTTGFDQEKVKSTLAAAGYTYSPDTGDPKLGWFSKGNSQWLVYLSTETREINLYIGKGKMAQVQQTTPSPQIVQAAANKAQTSAGKSGGSNIPVPPVMERQTAPVPPGTTGTPPGEMVAWDLDGNRYPVMKIGEKYWFKENLRTTQYRDTTAIATGGNAQEWSKTKAGAFAVYDDKQANKEKYGLLYNGYAAASGKLCPEGWRVATDADWQELERFYGVPESELERTGERGAIAGKLKTEDDWKPSAFRNDNSSGFSIIPAGSRLDNGEYTTLNQYGNFWTSTVYDDRYGLLYLWNHHVHFNSNAVGRIYTLAGNGYSIRCVRDKAPDNNSSSLKNERKPGTNQTTGSAPPSRPANQEQNIRQVEQSSTERMQSGSSKASPGTFTFSISQFDDGWVSRAEADRVVVEKGEARVYLYYAVSYNSDHFSGTGVTDRDYYWDNHVARTFRTTVKKYNDAGEFISSLQPKYVEGWGTDPVSGRPAFVAMVLSIAPNAAQLTVASYPDEASFRQAFPRANDKYASDLVQMSRYNKFAVAASDLNGTWQSGGSQMTQWYDAITGAYSGATFASSSATFHFNSGNSYSSIHNGATGAVGAMNTFQQEYKGAATVANWNVILTNRREGKSMNFDTHFQAVRGGRLLYLNNRAGEEYLLVRIRL